MKEVKKYVFEYDVKGMPVQVEAEGTDMLTAESNSLIYLMREKGYSYGDIMFVRQVSVRSTGRWE